MDTALCRQTHQADGEGCLAHGTRHDNEGLRDLTEESDRDGILRDVGDDPLEVMAEALLHSGFDDGPIANEEDLLARGSALKESEVVSTVFRTRAKTMTQSSRPKTFRRKSRVYALRETRMMGIMTESHVTERMMGPRVSARPSGEIVGSADAATIVDAVSQVDRSNCLPPPPGDLVRSCFSSVLIFPNPRKHYKRVCK